VDDAPDGLPPTRDVLRLLTAEAVQCATGVMQGTVPPYEAAKRLSALQCDIKGLVALAEQLTVFVGLAAAWEDVPDQPDVQKEYERRIVIAAEILRRCYSNEPAMSQRL
jgi:hypothetical protein